MCILQAVNSKVLGKLASTMLKNWMNPRPIKEEHLVVAAVVELKTQRKQLKKWGKLMVDDPDVALKSAVQLLGGVPVVHSRHHQEPGSGVWPQSGGATYL